MWLAFSKSEELLLIMAEDNLEAMLYTDATFPEP
jgi:hypothetical protein